MISIFRSIFNSPVVLLTKRSMVERISSLLCKRLTKNIKINNERLYTIFAHFWFRFIVLLRDFIRFIFEESFYFLVQLEEKKMMVDLFGYRNKRKIQWFVNSFSVQKLPATLLYVHFNGIIMICI